MTFFSARPLFFSLKLMKSVISFKIRFLCFSNKFEEGFNKR